MSRNRQKVFRLASKATAVLLVGVAVSAALAPSIARAQEPPACLSQDPKDWPSPSKPYFMIAFDTSGSMTSTVSTTNSCGYPNNRIGHGRCALKNTVQAFAGEVNFGLATFAWRNECTGAANPNDCPSSGTCSAVYAPGTNNFCGPWLNEPTLSQNVHSGGHVVVPMLQDHYWSLPQDPTNVGTILQMADNSCGTNNGVNNGNGTWNGELGANSNTPLGGVLFDMHRYFSGTYTDKWSSTTLASPIGTLAQGERSCRSLNIILITDGDETCDSGVNPTPIAGGCRAGFGSYLNNSGERLATYEADRLYTQGITFGGQNFKVRTHVIAFAGADLVAAGHIASCGGTGSAYSTANEAQLSQALSNIISSAIKPETCDNTDNNCNGCTDEGYKHYCNIKPSGQCCAWSNQTQRTTCLNNYQGSITPGNPTGDLTLLPCTTATQQTQPQNWLCYDPKELCDNSDNNCNGSTDEGFNKCGSPAHCPQAETCNGQDDDCDAIIDNSSGSGVPYSACPNNCQPSAEICDGCDNDCDGVADNGVADIDCGFSPPTNCAGKRVCLSKGVSVPVGGCVGSGVPKGFGTCNNSPQAEICDGQDNNCNGTVDEGIAPTECEIPGQPGLVYQDAAHPNSQCLKGLKPCNGTCSGWVGPTPEVCDGIDNDCNGVVDDNVPGVGNVCGTSTGQCQKGTTACVGGVLVCQGGVQPQPETCNGLDDNCDGTADNAPLTDQPSTPGCWQNSGNCCQHQNLHWCPPAGATCNGVGSLSTPCQTGSLVCDGANGWKCQGGKLPTPEVCDGVDNNCNGTKDDGLGSPIGDSCGINVGECTTGVNICDNGVIKCNGKGGTPEICDGKDNDCDGTIDNGLPIGGSCTPTYDTNLYPGDRTKGECSPGVNQCDPNNPTVPVCVGGQGPQPEVCDGKDNDCDGLIDEPGPAPDGIDGTTNPLDPNQKIGDACGTDEGECKKGKLSCDKGKFVCTGGVGPQPEACDCLDNDCNGKIDDEATIDGGAAQNLCSPGKTCVEVQAGLCQCASPCGSGEFPCPTGSDCKTVNKSGTTQTAGNFCVSDNCGDCSTKTVKDSSTGEVLCGPGGGVPLCVCKGNSCKDPCDGITCPTGQECAKQGAAAGTCQPVGNCYFFGCDPGKLCNGGVCVDDPCDPNTCQAGEVCKPNATFDEPRCVGSCAGVTCSAGQECVEGQCTDTGCGTDCANGEVCQPDGDGGFSCGPSKCVTEGGLPCSNGAYCDPTTGQCGNDPCEGVVCPSGQVCAEGECDWAPEAGTGGSSGTGGGGSGGTGGKDGGAGGSTGTGGTGGGTTKPTNEEPQGVWGLATGGGGCACRTSGSERRVPAAPIALVGVALSAMALRRRRRRHTKASEGASK
ncbi:MAG: hypothetical protein KC776_16030 [Myxococcales bacterium]|nr:hypothetical protein [Myxococcales bacterium]MCB9582979.1 hypothetical protein [Polyangiaceae bacterium]